VTGENGAVEVEGCGPIGLHEPSDVLDCGNSGTTLRTLLGICAAVDGVSILSGDRSLRARPMMRVVAPLRRLGAHIDGRRGGELPPLVVRGGHLTGTEIKTAVASAQVKTALLLAGLFADGETRVVEPERSRDHTERMLADAGVDVRVDGTAVSVPGGCRPGPRDRRVPGDVSSALFLVVAALIVPDSDLLVHEVGLNPSRTGSLSVLQEMGADLEIVVDDDWGGEPVGSIRVRSSDLRGTAIGPDGVAALVDEVPVLAVAAAVADGETRFTGMSELRVKESDRVAAMVDGLRSAGVDAEELSDGFVVRGPARLHDAVIDARGDHRIAMAFAVADQVAEGSIGILGWRSVETSFPEFLDVLAEAQRAS
jgi:3-phosphoshikimate 1-carboxyvinyltransferase